MVRVNTLSEDAAQVLEEKLELSNVTDLRKNLLPAIEGIAKNPALRYLILKRGRPQAVLMSVRTYDLVKKIMNQVASTQATLPREEKIESAYERLRAERGRARPVTITPQSAADAFERLRTERSRARAAEIPATSSVVDEEISDRARAAVAAGIKIGGVTYLPITEEEISARAAVAAGIDAQKVDQVMSMLREIRTDMKELRRSKASKADVASVNDSML